MSYFRFPLDTLWGLDVKSGGNLLKGGFILLSNYMVMEFRRMLEKYRKTYYPDFDDLYDEESSDIFDYLKDEEIDESTAHALFEYEDDDGEAFEIETSIWRNEEDELETRCNCSDFKKSGKCVHLGMLLKDISDGILYSEESYGYVTLPTLIPEEPDYLEDDEILETVKENPEMFARCMMAMDESLASDIATSIRDRNHVYKRLNYLSCYIDSKARDRDIPEIVQLHYVYELASNFAAAATAFDDINMRKLIEEEVQLMTAAVIYRERCLKYGDPFYMNLIRVCSYINKQLWRVPEDERFDVIVNSLYPLDEESAENLLFGVEKMLSEEEVKALGVKLAEKNLKEAAKRIGWKKKKRKPRK